MKPLIVLLGVFILTLIAMVLIGGYLDYNLAGITGISAMLVFTSIGHFAFTKGMMMMMPPAIPFKKAIVWITGVLEFAAAIMIFVPQYQYATSVLLIIFFICVLPANIYGAMEEVDIQKANNTGDGLRYLWFRIPFQLFLIAWTWYFGIHPNV